MIETKTVPAPSQVETNREELISQINELVSDEAFRAEGLAWLKDQFDSGAYYPLTGREELEALLEDNPDIAKLFNLIGQLTPHELREVPSVDQFAVLDQKYVGADGKERHPHPKYVPKHMHPYLTGMQQEYAKFIELHKAEGDLYAYIGENGRPGLIVLSGFRSDYYQFGIMAREMLQRGADGALQLVALPGSSQHGDPENCAVDFTTIGDRNGNNITPDGRSIGFEDTIEFQWLLRNCVNHGFWVSYSPNPENPMSEVGFDGIVPEPWHYQFLGNSEAAADSMAKRRVVESFAARARVFGNQAISMN